EPAEETTRTDADLVRRLRLRLRPDTLILGSRLDTDGVPDDAALPSIDGYNVLGVIGRGGMGVVYKAEQLSLQRIVALKMLRVGKVPEAASRSRFRNEVLAVRT